MAESSNQLRVHLDHLIKRESLRYTSLSVVNDDRTKTSIKSDDHSVRYEDIMRLDGWFSRIRKPDFQRETNAWTPEDCVEFLDSVVQGRIIPSIILWHSPENGYVYVLDGAHRLSVIRAWMSDDWGNNAGDYYERRDKRLIDEAAKTIRDLVKIKLGSFEDFRKAAEELDRRVEEGEAPKQIMDPKSFSQAQFYIRVVRSLSTLYVQWEQGGYEIAEQSFLRINQGGQALNKWEATLIEYRNSSYARAIMSIANGGESGHYWPQPKKGENISEALVKAVEKFRDKTAGIHERLFVPPFKVPINVLSVPLMVTPPFFQKHKHLLEIIPLISFRQIAAGEEDQIKIMKRDFEASPEVIIQNSEEMLTKLEEGLDHFISPTSNSKSLALVPLFYWYNERGQHVRGLLYGFIYWMLTGSREDIKERKIAFSTYRGKFEDSLFRLKADIAGLQVGGGAGLKGVKRTSKFFNQLTELLANNPTFDVGSDELYTAVFELLNEFKHTAKSKSKSKKSRAFSKTDKSQINIRSLWENAIRCHICGGVVDLHYGGLQYDHVTDYAKIGVTDPDNGEPTHPFCNNFKRIIQKNQKDGKCKLPGFNTSPDEAFSKDAQLSLNLFWGDDDFPE